ncbi:MAG TPA: SemiSWEET transporter [Bacteroidaceae bacterium]|nr:SemiSWEET transporter [Bacteroidaceae bacterium]
MELFGYIAAFLTSVSFIPQALKTIRTRDTQGISLLMYAIFSTGVLCWFIYGIAMKDLPILLANGVTLCFALIILFFKIRYK